MPPATSQGREGVAAHDLDGEPRVVGGPVANPSPSIGAVPCMQCERVRCEPMWHFAVLGWRPCRRCGHRSWPELTPAPCGSVGGQGAHMAVTAASHSSKTLAPKDSDGH